MTACVGCGDCCDPVGLASTLEVVATMVNLNGRGNDERDFILAHFHPISMEEARRRNPLVVDVAEGGRHYHECDQFDRATRRCLAYDERPLLCRAFPYHRDVPGWPATATTPAALVAVISGSNRCSFWADVPAELWPRDVIPLRELLPPDKVAR